MRRHGAVLASSLLLLGAALVRGMPAGAQQPTGTIRGTVRNSGTNLPLGSAQLSVAGSRLGTMSREDGSFVITSVPAGSQTVQAHLIGYAAASKTVTVVAGQTVRVDLVLNQAAVSLDEVVVTGTAGQARRREVGNSISAPKLPEATVAASVASVLQGRVPGASIELSGGSAGAGSSIRLRGNSSVALSNQPLVYIDGVRVRSDEYPKNMPAGGASPNLRGPNVYASPLNDLDPADIERVEVIKGAAATTLYGTEAAAGVIQIFTKKGSAGGAQWAFETQQGFNRERPFGINDAQYPNSATFQPNGSCTKTNECSEYLFINPWLRDGHKQQYLGSVSGGTTAGLRYFVSGDFNDNQGVLPLDDERKVSVRGNFSFQPTDKLTFEWSTGFTNDSIRNTPAGNNAAGLTLNAFRRNRNYFGSANIDTISQVLTYQLNTWINHLTLGGTINYTPFPAMTNKLTLGLDRSDLENRNLRPFGFVSLPQGGLSDEHWNSQLGTADYVGNFEHDLSVLGMALHTTSAWGGQLTTNEVRDLQSYTETFPGPGVPTVSSGATWNGLENISRIVTGGLFLQEMVGWRDRLFVTGGIRFDKYSAFGSNLGLQHYPKISASYVMSDEDYFPKQLGTLKLRAAYGQAGRAPGAFDALRTYLPVGWGSSPAFRTNSVGDPNLGPERSKETELGFDATTLEGRISMDFTYYHTMTDDALLPVRQIPSLGFLSSQLENVGTLEKHGVEIATNGDVFRSEPVTWNLGLNLAFNESHAVTLGGAPPFQLANYGWIYPGKPVADMRGRWVSNPNDIAAPIIVQDHEYGPSAPTHVFGFTTSLRFPHGIELAARADYQGGNYINEDASYEAISRSVQWPSCFRAYSTQSSATDESKWTAWERGYCDMKNGGGQDMFIFKADFFKLRDLSLRVPIAPRYVPGAKSAMVTLSVQNWWRWQNKDMRLFDPEMAGNDGFNATVRYISEHIPAPATVLGQLRLTF